MLSVVEVWLLSVVEANGREPLKDDDYREGLLISFTETLDELESSGFRLNAKLKGKLLKEVGAMRCPELAQDK